MSVLDIIPFQFLGARARAWLGQRLLWEEHAPGVTIVRQGDRCSRVYLLAEGRVDVLDHRRGPQAKVGAIEEGHYFGERTALFGEPQPVEIRAQTRCRTASMEGEVFLTLLRDEPHVAHALTFILRDKQGVFTVFERFLAEVRLGASRGHIVIGKLLPIYRQLRPALHRLLSSTAIDFDALAYVVRRLPSNVSTTFVWFATDELPVRYAEARALFRDTTPVARRRVTWEMMPGKSLILLRDGMSDLLDLVSALCIYAVEARKLRRRLRDGGVLCSLGTERAEEALVSAFDEEERERLEALWPGEVPQRLMEMSLHHEDITIHVYRRTNNYNSAHAETWTQQIAAATRALLGADPWELDEDYTVHIISSNTHSVTNCLSPWLQENREQVEAWGWRAHPNIMEADWAEPWDRLAALMRPYMKAHPEAIPVRMAQDGQARIQLDETAFTGIRVQLFDMGKLRDLEIDPHLPKPGGPGLIVNIDYAFGQQAEPIIANLVNLFGRRIRSINVLGKAGGLCGERGDVLVATAFVNQSEDVLVVPPRGAVDVERLAARLPRVTVHQGRILTVLGTVLQNDRLLHYYAKLWGCVGLEMEGSYYCRQALESQELGLIRDNTALRFIYYVSDLPLVHDSTLAARLGPLEGIPPLYGITREILTAVFA